MDALDGAHVEVAIRLWCDQIIGLVIGSFSSTVLFKVGQGQNNRTKKKRREF